MAEKEQCFIITPIGDENSEIRRHIEGIIDAVIKPALEEWYEIEVAHRISTPGSITKQIIEAIYNSKLVIANLTNCNPNVMYELALRHGIGKPVIMIAVEGTKLPSDIMMQRTIFYRNDARGVLELRDKLKNTAEKIDFEKKCGMVFEALGEISHDAAMLKKVAEKDSKYNMEDLMWLLDQIQILQTTKNKSEIENGGHIFREDYITIIYETAPCDKLSDINLRELLSVLDSKIPGFRVTDVRSSSQFKEIYVYFKYDQSCCDIRKVGAYLGEAIISIGYAGIQIRE